MHFSSALVSSFLFASAFLVGLHCEQCKSSFINRGEQLNGVSAGNEAGIRITEDYVCR